MTLNCPNCGSDRRIVITKTSQHFRGRIGSSIHLNYKCFRCGYTYVDPRYLGRHQP